MFDAANHCGFDDACEESGVDGVIFGGASRTRTIVAVSITPIPGQNGDGITHQRGWFGIGGVGRTWCRRIVISHDIDGARGGNG